MEEDLSNFIGNSSAICVLPNLVRFDALTTPYFQRSASVNDNESTIRTVAGSAGEFYVVPMLTCIGDVDVMVCPCDELVVPAWHRVVVDEYVESLPPEFRVDDEIVMSELVESELPNHVFLRRVGKLVRRVRRHRSTYEFVPETTSSSPRRSRRGARKQRRPSPRSESSILLDEIHCIRCLEWPPQVADWSVRPRQNDWPTTAAIESVIRSGCDVIPIRHCEREPTEQSTNENGMHRMHFTSAETILLNTLSTKQQNVYHVLRYYLRTIGYVEPGSTDGGLLNRYHLKTLLLWSCERRSQGWWASCSIVDIVVELLHELADWLVSRDCRHYFIAAYNLFDRIADKDSSALSYIASALSAVSANEINDWLLRTYVIKGCLPLCPTYVSRAFRKLLGKNDLHRALEACVWWRLAEQVPVSSVTNLHLVLRRCERLVSKEYVEVGDYRRFDRELRSVDDRASDFFTALALLHLARVDDVVEMVPVIDGMLLAGDDKASPVGLWSNRHRQFSRARLAFHRAIVLMADLQTIPKSSIRSLNVEVAKAFLYKSLALNESLSIDGSCIDNALVHVYLANLNYRTEEYRIAADHCRHAVRSWNVTSPSTSGTSYVVETQLVTSPDSGLDDDVTGVVSGLLALYNFTWKGASDGRLQSQSRCVDVFTTELFALYQLVQCSRKCQIDDDDENELARRRQDARRYVQRVRTNRSMFVGDILLCYFLAKKNVIDTRFG